MEDIFQNTESGKKEKIINSALEEFSKNSFDQSSTNNIVENAGISKGLLYHYFDSKKNLYQYLESFAIKTMTDAIVDKLDWEESDLFKRMKQIILIKMKVCLKYPYLVAFTKSLYQNKSLEEMKAKVEKYSPDIYHKAYYYNIDFCLFKDEIDLEKTIKIIQWVLEKFSEEWLQNEVPEDGEIDYEVLVEDIEEYLNILKKAFYK
jgi:AcrR family transcriptional regulator